MSTNLAKDKRRRSLLLRPFSRAVNVSVSRHGIQQSSRHSFSMVGSSSRRSLGRGSRVLDRIESPRTTVRVLDEEGNDVTPMQLGHSEPGAAQDRASRFFLDEISDGLVSDHTMTTGSFTMPFLRSVLGSSRISSQSTIESVNEEIEDTFFKRDVPVSFPDEKEKKDSETEQLTEDMLKEIVEVFISETDTIVLFDMQPIFVASDADNAEVIVERKNRYAEVCRKRKGNRPVDVSMQTLSGATKNKQVQKDSVSVTDAATAVSTFDLYMDPEQEETAQSPESEQTDYTKADVDSNRSGDRSMSVTSTATTVSGSSSLKEVETLGIILNPESDSQLTMLSETFQHSLLVMERSILWNHFQPQLAVYRQLPVLKDPDRPERSEEKEQREDMQLSRSPSLECLWVFSCELSKGLSVSSMSWNKKNQDLLAVGYGEFDSKNLKPGLVCCWSIKNPTWPEQIIHCESAVTCLDFSVSSPTQLAVGMYDGSIAIYNVQSPDKSNVISSRECPKRHVGPVWQLRWNQQKLILTGEEKVEALFSVGADGRISKWFIFNGGLDCIDLMKLESISNTMRKAGGNKTVEMARSVVSPLNPGLCFDFHPTDSSIYLVGTCEGLIHKCSCSNSQHFLETYRKHLFAVNCITWCPSDPHVFLSCCADWTIQLWRQDHQGPVLGLTSTQTAVCDIKWSPKWAMVFGAVNERQLEIWNLNSSLQTVLWSETVMDR
ncbi:dynein intermediate chain 4, axonemal isoform X2 [Melanotaenia boesemani]|uniref:dynein intermediate chain 4, axonemal isoform X2 n=1 Tax=Melanotaenia boesemani TaxID=1250792 RepID=UPI001C046306|nr:dynein intermediate chain 4, axonemal isoform X2 [Melanotaenia boesemani]